MMTLKEIIARGLTSIVGKDTSSSMLGFVSGTSGTSPKRGTKGMLNAYNELPWFRAIVGKISRSTSTQQWRVFVQKSNGKPIRNVKISTMTKKDRIKFIQKGLDSGEVEEIEGHPITDVLNEGNPYLPGSINLQVSQIHIDSVGDSFLLKQRNGVGVVEFLLPLPPHWIIGTPTPGGPQIFKISIGSIQEDIPAEDMIWLKDPNPVNPYERGSGIALSLIDELETDEFAAKHTKSWFYNSAKPDIIVSAEGLEQGATKRLEEDWMAKNNGFLKRFKPYFMNTKVTVQQLNSSFKDMQLIQLREFERDTIIQIYGVPPEIMGIVENSNRATINSADFIFAKHVLIPRLELQRTSFQVGLVPEYDDRLILDYDSPLQEDDEFKLKIMTSQPHAFYVDEFRELAGMGELENGTGKVHAIPFNIIFSSTLTSEVPEPTTPIEIGEEEKRVGKIKTLSPDDVALVKRVVMGLRAQIIVDAITPSIESIVQSFGETIASSIGDANFNIDDPVVREFVTTQSGNRIRNLVDNTTRKRLRSELVQGLEDGENINDLTRRVNRVFDTATSNRSKVIARTETVRAANFGSQEGMYQAGVDQKEWLSSRDTVTRDSHKPGTGLDGEIVSIRANFKSPITGAEGPFPGELGLASEDIQCRCTTVPFFGDEERSFKVMTEVQKAAIWKAFDMQRRPFENKLRIDVNKGFEQQRKDVLLELAKEK